MESTADGRDWFRAKIGSVSHKGKR